MSAVFVRGFVVAAIAAFAAASSINDAPPVSVELYMEALCPFCAVFVHTLDDLMKAGWDDKLALTFVPWGNARVMDDGEIQCQHGKTECTVNTIASCVYHLYPEQATWFPWSVCVEGTEDIVAASESCAEKTGLDWAKIKDCADGETGKSLQKDAKALTDKLVPEHQWVPWVIVNGVPIFDDTPNFKQILCVTYTGTRPDTCFQPPAAKKAKAEHGFMAALSWVRNKVKSIFATISSAFGVHKH